MSVARDRAFVDRVLTLLAPLGPVRARAMFGGWGLYLDDAMLGLIAGERLYLRTDETTRAAFEAAGCSPFVYQGRNGRVTMPYWSPPAGGLDTAAALQPWAERGLAAARRVAAAKQAGRGARRGRTRRQL